MLDKKYLKLACGIGRYDSKMVAIPDTPLSLLARTIPIGAIDLPSCDTSSFIEKLSDTEENQATLEEILSLAVPAVTKELSFVRTKVMPHIRSALERYTEESKYLLTRRGNDYTIEPVFLPDFLNTDVFRELVSGKTPTVTDIPRKVCLGKVTEENVLDAIKFTDRDNFSTLLSKYLSENNRLDIVLGILNNDRNSFFDDPGIAIAVYLTLETMTVPNPDTGATLSQWETCKVVLSAAALSTLIYIYRKDMDQLQSGNFFIDVDKDYRTIRVVGENYNAWVEKGLTPEVVIGWVILDRKYSYLDLLDPTVSTHCKNAYANLLASNSLVDKQEEAITRRNMIRSVLFDDLKSRTEDMVLEGDTIKSIGTRINIILNSSFETFGSMVDPVYLIAAAICGSWYHHLNVAYYVNAALTLDKENPDIDVRIVEQQATVQYIADWVAGMLYAVK